MEVQNAFGALGRFFSGCREWLGVLHRLRRRILRSRSRLGYWEVDVPRGIREEIRRKKAARISAQRSDHPGFLGSRPALLWQHRRQLVRPAMTPGYSCTVSAKEVAVRFGVT